MSFEDLYPILQKAMDKLNGFRPPAFTQPVSLFGITAVYLNTQYLNQWCYHKHKFDELNFIFSGKAMYCFENGKQITISENEWILIPNGQSHRIFQADKKTLKISILFSFSHKENKNLYTYYENIIKGLAFLHGNISESFVENMNYICQNVFFRDVSHQVLAWNGIVSLIFGVVGKIHSQKKQEEPNYLDPSDDQRYIRAVQFIKDNRFRPIHVPEVATHCNISQKQLNRLFQHHLQCSVVQFIQQQRLIAAQHMLLSDDRPLYLISSELGFCDEFYFSRFFQKMMKISPTQYRDIHNVN